MKLIGSYLNKTGLLIMSIVLAGLMAVSPVAAADEWVDQASSGAREWRSIASSADGTKLVATVQNDYIYRSADSGTTWSELTGAGLHPWGDIASSADGTVLVAAHGAYSPAYSYLRVSTDSGTTWSELTGAGLHPWRSIAVSEDGTKMAAVTNENSTDGYVYTSADSGLTWTEHTSAGFRDWSDVTMSDDGTNIVAIAYAGSNLAYSTNGGVSWTVGKIGGGNSPGLSHVASSSDGAIVFVATAAHAQAGGIYKSINYGSTWTKTSAVSDNHSGIVVSSDGSKVVATSGSKYGKIRTSTNGGSTWSTKGSTPPGSNSYTGITSNADGNKLAVIIDKGDIWTTGATPVSEDDTDNNGDDIPDDIQPGVYTLPNPVTEDIVVIEIDSTTCTGAEIISANVETPQQEDKGYTYPVGLTDFTFTCSAPGVTTSVTLYVYGDYDADDFTLRKFSSSNEKYSPINDAVIQNDTINGKSVLKVTYAITDGGELDEDGVANGTIVDPVGLAMIEQVNPATPGGTGNPTNSGGASGGVGTEGQRGLPGAPNTGYASMTSPIEKSLKPGLVISLLIGFGCVAIRRLITRRTN